MVIRRIATSVFSQWYLHVRCPGCLPFHSNPSCSLKNSRKAGSFFNDDNSLVDCFDAPFTITELRRSAGEDDDLDRHICARRPSSCRRPLRILMPSLEDK